MSIENNHVKKSYEHGVLSYSEFWGSEPHQFTQVDRLSFAKNLKPGSSILEVGCGPGRDSAWFVDKGFQVVGIDLSESMIREASQNAPGAQFHVMDMTQLDFEEARFDAIWGSFSFLHIPEDDADTVLKGFLRVLKPEGLLFLALHSASKTNLALRPVSGLTRDGESLETYIQEWNQDHIVQKIESCGFEMMAIRSFEREGGLYPLLSLLMKSNSVNQD